MSALHTKRGEHWQEALSVLAQKQTWLDQITTPAIHWQAHLLQTPQPTPANNFFQLMNITTLSLIFTCHCSHFYLSTAASQFHLNIAGSQFLQNTAGSQFHLNTAASQFHLNIAAGQFHLPTVASQFHLNTAAILTCPLFRVIKHCTQSISPKHCTQSVSLKHYKQFNHIQLKSRPSSDAL